MEITSLQKFVHTSPRKLRLVADMVRRQRPEKALLTLRFANRAAAKELGMAINTALANAGQSGLNMETLGFKSIEVNEGPKMRRFRAGARGRVKPYKRRMSHIRIILSDEIVVAGKTEKSAKTVQEQKTAASEVKVENKISEKEVVVDDSTTKPKVKKGGRTESSKKK